MDPETVSVPVQETGNKIVQPWYSDKFLYLLLKYSEDPEHIIHCGNSGSLILPGWIGDKKVAVKKSPITAESLNEGESLRQLNHPNIILYILFHSENPHNIYLITELGHRTLEEMIQKVEREVRLRLGRGVLCGLAFLHKQEIVHGDVKHQHVVVGADGQAKLIDFKKSKKVTKGDREISNEIKKAGELEYYIVSGGESYPEEEGIWVTKDITMHFIQCMIHQDPNKRSLPLFHAIFWNKRRQLRFLKNVGNLPRDYFTGKVVGKMNTATRKKSFQNWRETMEKESPKFLKEMDDYRIGKGKKAYSNTTRELLLFIRNGFIHRLNEAKAVGFTSLFPDLFKTIYVFTQEMGWKDFEDESEDEFTPDEMFSNLWFQMSSPEGPNSDAN